MAIFETGMPIESGEQIVRARRTAAWTRVFTGVAGIGLVLEDPSFARLPLAAGIGFATILLSALVQLAAPRLPKLAVEESLSAVAGVLIVGLDTQRVDVLSLLWLVAVASGVLARGGRVHWFGRAVVLGAMALPIVREATLEAQYAVFCAATVALLLTSGRLTRELNALLREARVQADSAEALLLAGDIAARMSGREGTRRPVEEAETSEPELQVARAVLARLVRGDGLKMIVQPIVDIRSGGVHAFEALARFGEDAAETTPLQWFALAERLGCRAALERACLRSALELLPIRPAGTNLSVNLSVQVLLEAETLGLLEQAAAGRAEELDGLIVEITEETLVDGGAGLHDALGPLLALGACLAVDDVGAGYSGLRQITAVRPSYLKLDKALAAGIDRDEELAALVGALVGYARQVGCLLVAEGVETTAELRALQRIGVPLVQGFRLSRPGDPWPSVDAHEAAAPRSSADGAADPVPVPAPPAVLDPEDWYELERAHLRGRLVRV